MSYKQQKKYYSSHEAYLDEHRRHNRRYYAKTPSERAANSYERWTRDDINILTHWASDDHSLALILGRTIRAVQKKRYELKKRGY